MVQWVNKTESQLTHTFVDKKKGFEKIELHLKNEIFQGSMREDKKIILWNDGDVWKKKPDVSRTE